MKELIEIMARTLVEDPEAVSVEETMEEDVIVFELRVAESDLGRVIGREGKIAKAMRLIIRSAAARLEQKATVRIID
ncbi:MAG: KH domain-containing protein [Candidatus Aegiribacteria sp.]|nr:KH domain-containing protein [Candidatus Aegiribacteria sp.]